MIAENEVSIKSFKPLNVEGGKGFKILPLPQRSVGFCKHVGFVGGTE